MIDKKIEEIENYMDEFYSIPKVVPNPKYNYEIYTLSTDCWLGVFQVDGDKNLYKKKVSKFNPRWKVFDNSKIAEKQFLFTPIFGKHSECKEKDFDEYRKAQFGYFNHIVMSKYKSKKLVNIAAEFYDKPFNDFKSQFGEIGIIPWYLDKENKHDEFSYIYDKGTKAEDLIKPIWVTRFNEPLKWYAYAKQDGDYWNAGGTIRFKKI